MLNIFRRTTLEGILDNFERVASDLSNHIDRKAAEAFNLHAAKAEVETKIESLGVEIDRAERVLSKVVEFVA